MCRFFFDLEKKTKNIFHQIWWFTGTCPWQKVNNSSKTTCFCGPPVWAEYLSAPNFWGVNTHPKKPPGTHRRAVDTDANGCLRIRARVVCFCVFWVESVFVHCWINFMPKKLLYKTLGKNVLLNHPWKHGTRLYKYKLYFPQKDSFGFPHKKDISMVQRSIILELVVAPPIWNNLTQFNQIRQIGNHLSPCFFGFKKKSQQNILQQKKM